MSFTAKITYSGGDDVTFVYRLAQIARYLKRKRAIEENREVKSMPVTPWLVDMAFVDALTACTGREIARIHIEEKVIT